MDRPVPKALKRAAFIVAAILVAYLIVSLLSLAIPRGNWLLIVAVAVFILAIGIPFFDRAFGDKLPLLHHWPTPSANARIRRILGFAFLGGGDSFNNPQTGKQVAVNMLWASSLFLLLLAVVSIRLLLGRPVSDLLALLLATAFLTSTGIAAFQFMQIRLRPRYDLRSVLLAIAIYAPITMVVLGVFLVWGEVTDDGPFRIPRGLLLFILPFGVFMTALVALLYSLRKSEAPVPTFASHPLYQRAEIATSLASYAAVAIIFLLSS